MNSFGNSMSLVPQTPVDAIILAAGKGTRMKSSLPKVLHPLFNIPILEHVIKNLLNSNIRDIIIILSPEINAFKQILDKYPKTLVCIQNQARGTADAAAAAAVCLNDIMVPPYTNSELLRGDKFTSEWILICTGDVPTFKPSMILNFKEKVLALNSDIAVLAFEPENPYGYGRILSDNKGNITKIIEENDCDEEQAKIRICNSGIILAKTKLFFEVLSEVKANNKKNEYYLTDIISIAYKKNLKMNYVMGEPWYYLVGINTQEQLNELTRLLQNE